MHIAEGFLPVSHAVGWTVTAVPFVGYGLRHISRLVSAQPGAALRIGAAGAFSLLLTSLKLPSVGGSSSHPTGCALGAYLCGPAVMAGLGPMVLMFQALFLAHGGITTLGANAMAMSVVGPWCSWGTWQGLRRLGVPSAAAAGFGAVTGVLATYATTAGQLALAFPDPQEGISGAFVKFATVFAWTQLPLSLVEGVTTVVALKTLEAQDTPAAQPHG